MFLLNVIDSCIVSNLLLANSPTTFPHCRVVIFSLLYRYLATVDSPQSGHCERFSSRDFHLFSTPVLLRDVPGPVFALSSWCFSVLGDVASAARRVMDFLKGGET
jgi:hypothetical protein